MYFNYPFETGKTYDLQLVYDATAKYIKLYVNGELAEEKELAEAMPLMMNEITYIGGCDAEDRFFIGMMDHFMLWDHPMQATEAENAISSEMGLLLHFDFEGKETINLIEKDPEMPELPRFGMRMEIAGKFDQLNWFGRGPHENYQDRNTAAFVRHYQSSVDDQYFPYIRPQENGYKTDTRWLALTDSTGKGMMIIGEPVLSFSALPYSIEDLDQGTKNNYRHTSDLVARDFISLNVDYKQTGVGGDNSWGARPHPQYTLQYGQYQYTYIIRPLIRKVELMEESKKRYR